MNLVGEENDPGDRWSDLDDTLADGPAPASVPAEAKPWLASQRFVHGLLRALHTADAQDREGRVRRILGSLGERSAQPVPELDSIGAEDAGEPRRPVRDWLLFAAAAAVLAAIALWSWLPSELPTVEAAVQRAADALGGDVDRTFRIEVEAQTPRGARRNSLTLTSRPGMRFLLEGKVRFGMNELGFRSGCDGEVIWFRAANGSVRIAEPLAKADRLVALLGDVMDVGYLDVQALIAKLPATFPLHTVERRVDPATGKELVRVATEPAAAAARLRSAWLEYDEATGVVERLEVVGDGRDGVTRRITFVHTGTVPAGEVDYRRPW